MTDTYQPVTLEPRFSARNLIGPRFLLAFGVMAAALVVIAVIAPSVEAPILTGLVAAFYLASSIDRNYLLLRGIRTSGMMTVTDEEALALTDDELPTYTVLLPVYDEPSIVANLLNGVGRLDYPRDKLEILLLVEEDDLPTRWRCSKPTSPRSRWSSFRTACRRRSQRHAIMA